MLRVDGYTVFDHIGTGGIGDVYLAEQSSTGVEVAIKLVRHVDDTSLAWRRIERELRALAELVGHAHVIGVIEVVALGSDRALVMEYAPGGSLARFVHEQRRLDTPEIVLAGRQLCTAVEAAHERGIIHRDIKPQNLLIDAFGQVKLCDFGIASLLRLEEFRERTSSISMRYASPEDVEDEVELIGPPTDIYSVGATLLFLRRGSPPTTMERVAGWKPPINRADPEGQALDEVIAACLEVDPMLRPTAGAAREQLERLERRLSKPVGAIMGEEGDDDPETADQPQVYAQPVIGTADDLFPTDAASDWAPERAGLARTASPPQTPAVAEPEADQRRGDRDHPQDGERDDADDALRAMFGAATKPYRPPTSHPSIARDPDGIDATVGRPRHDQASRTTPSPGRRSRRSSARIGVVVGAVVVAGVALVFARAARRSSPDSATTTAPPAVSVTRASGTSVAVAPPTTVRPEVPYAARPSDLGPLRNATWPVVGEGACVVQRVDEVSLVKTGCDDPHDLQSIAVVDIGDDANVSSGTDELGAERSSATRDDAPSAIEAEIESAASAACRRAFAHFVHDDDSTSLEQTRLAVEASVPTVDDWVAGDRMVQCWVRLPGGRLVGDARGTGW